MKTTFMKQTLVLFILIIVSSAVSAEEFNTIENAPEEKERGTLSKADSKKALDGFRTTINTIQSTLERCESEVCRQVSANADKRDLLVTQAQENIDDAESYIIEVRGIVREDITALEKCGTDICKKVLSQEKELLVSINDFLDVDSDADGLSDAEEATNGDVDGDGYGDVSNSVEQARELAMSCPDDKCIMDLLALCDDDDCVVATLEAAVKGEIILGEDRDMVMPGAAQHCRNNKCIVELAEMCEDERCVAAVSQHCKDDMCVKSLADSSEEVTDVCIVVRESCPNEARAEGKCIVKSDVCTSDNQQGCVQLADRCPDDARADGSCVATSTVCGTSQGRVAGSPCPPDEALCMDGTCEPLTWPRCESDLDVAAVPAAGIASDDCDDTDCNVRPSATKKGYDHYQAQSDVRAGINPHSLNDTTIEYLQNQSELRGADLGLAVAYAASGNEQVRNVRYNNETDEVEVEHVEEVKLFGFIPMQANARSTIDREGNMRTNLPWWSFLASKRPDMLVKEWDEAVTEELDIFGEEVDILGMGEEK